LRFSKSPPAIGLRTPAVQIFNRYQSRGAIDLINLRWLLSPLWRVTGIAAAVLAAHISDSRIRLLVLGLEGGDQRILGIDYDMPRALVELKTYGILHFPAS